jgi:hypothetical protein
MLIKYCSHLLIATALFVCASVSSHPYLDAEDLCGLGGCPEASHTTGFSTACIAAVLAAAVATPPFRRFFKRRWVGEHQRPNGPYLQPDTPPPRVSPSR